jgi:hypothetical protein
VTSVLLRRRPGGDRPPRGGRLRALAAATGRAGARRRLAAAAALLAAAAAGAPAARAGVAPGELAGQARAAFVAAELEAAKTGDLYLVIDPGGSRLDLKCEGVLLHTFALRGSRFAPPPRSSGRPAWPAVAFRLSEGLAEPRRPEIAPPQPGAEPAPAPPPTTASGGIDFAAKQREEILGRAPASYLLTFTPALEVAVLGLTGAPGEEERSLSERLVEGWHRLRRWTRGPDLPPRLTIELPAADARRLFLDLEQDIQLLVAVPPGPETVAE